MLHLTILVTVNSIISAVKETVKEFVPVDTYCVIHKLRVLLKFSWNVVHL